ncbi:MAG: helix-turn-helix domain-containing protein [Bacteroidales bacterium]
MYKKKDLIKSPEYWLENIQDEIFRLISEYMKKNKINQTELAKEWGVSKGYISQILNGNFNFSLLKFIELVIAVEKIPVIKFENISEYLNKIENLEQPKKTLFIKYENCQYTSVTQKSKEEQPVTLRDPDSQYVMSNMDNRIKMLKELSMKIRSSQTDTVFISLDCNLPETNEIDTGNIFVEKKRNKTKI